MTAGALDDLARRELALSGTIRAAINLGNPLLARAGGQGADPEGISVALAREAATRAGLPLRLVAYPSAGHVFDALARNEWDLAFLAIEPARAVAIAFSAPYFAIEGTYLVAREGPHATAADVDQPGTRIGVVQKAAYDLFLTRTLQAALLQRFAGPAPLLAAFDAGELEAVAGIRQVLDDAARGRARAKVLPDRFMTIEQAMAVPIARRHAAAWVAAFVGHAIADGTVARIVAADAARLR